MDEPTSKPKFSRRIGKFRGDKFALVSLGLFALLVALFGWVARHPQHNPYAPLDLRDPIGWATSQKLAALRKDVDACREVLSRSQVEFTTSPATGQGACAQTDRTRLSESDLSPQSPYMTCPVAVALTTWKEKTVIPAAREIMGSELATIEHLGTYNCRRMRGNDSGAWSEHATGNAIDIAAFVLEDGRRISLIDDWNSGGDAARFLREVRDGACGVFSTVLSPDYNAAHADHFHLDQDDRWSGVCR